MAKVQNFSENLERSFSRLGNEAGERLRSPEAGPGPEKEAVKESLRAMAEAVPAVPAAPAPGAPAASDGEDAAFLPAYLSSETDPAAPEAKQAVEQLVSLTFQTDIETAVAAAKRYPPFIEDAFHDALVDKLLPELRKRGYLK